MEFGITFSEILALFKAHELYKFAPTQWKKISKYIQLFGTEIPKTSKPQTIYKIAMPKKRKREDAVMSLIALHWFCP